LPPSAAPLSTVLICDPKSEIWPGKGYNPTLAPNPWPVSTDACMRLKQVGRLTYSTPDHMSSSSGKKIISHGGIYLLGTIMRRSVSLIMLPIYTRCLTPADYGVIELLSMILDLVGIVLGLRVGQAIFRFYYKYKDPQNKNEVISTALYLVSGLNMLGICLIFVLATPLAVAVLGDAGQTRNLILFSLTLLGQSFIEIPLMYLRTCQRPWLFFTFSTLKLFLQLSLNIYFVVMLNMHVEGVIYSALISSSIMGLLLGGYTLWHTGYRFSSEKAKQLTSFSLPLMLTGVLTFYITFGDRYFLRTFGGLTQVGIYSLGYKFGFILMFLVVQPFNSIWDSEKYIVYEKRDAKAQYQRIFLLFSALTIFVCTGISVYIKELLKIMSTEPFWPAYRVVPVILAAYLVNAWSSFINLGILLKNKTIETTYAAILAAVVSTVGYIALIPLYGEMGAAIVTLLGFGIRNIWIYLRAKRLYDMGLAWGKVACLVLIGAVATLVAVFGPEDLMLAIGLDTALFAAACTSFILLPILPKNYRSTAKQIIKNPWRYRARLNVGNT